MKEALKVAFCFSFILYVYNCILFAIASKSLFWFHCISIFVLIDSCFYHHTHSVYAFVIWTSVFFFYFWSFLYHQREKQLFSIFRILFRKINVNIIQWMPFYFLSIETSSQTFTFRLTFFCATAQSTRENVSFTVCNTA